ncbi:sensor histidine kinase [Mangrovibacterium diazotrophicum]|uniref:sensor histidine kinase n=1 Tax=Mangrovibacterium diazotrophicum TaxID=1261403 RepID=UPI0011C43443|nr:histidine kinase [Mangrovibacterium diazotrophicum]
MELTAIRAQMNPHFMYNCLNSIQNLVQQKRSDEAQTYISKFASLIRDVLKYSDKEEITLAEELNVIENYVSLENLRFDIDFRTHLDEQVDIYAVFVPPLLLQPLVENAIIHGLAPKADDKRLDLQINARPDFVCITIEDNGVGRKRVGMNKNQGTGNGLKFSRERLDLMKAKLNIDYKMTITDLETPSGEPIGTRVEICISDE